MVFCDAAAEDGARDGGSGEGGRGKVADFAVSRSGAGGVTAAVEEGGGDEGETAAGRPGEGGAAKRGLAALRVFVPDDAEGGAFFGGEEVEVAVAIDVEQFDAIELDAGGAAD